MTEIDIADSGTESGIAETRRGPCLVLVRRRRTFVNRDYFAIPVTESEGSEATSRQSAAVSEQTGSASSPDAATAVELPETPIPRRAYTRRAAQPDFEYIDQQINRGGMTLRQLHSIYCEQGVGRRLYGYSRFCAVYAEWAARRPPTSTTTSPKTIDAQA